MNNVVPILRACTGPCGRNLPATREHFYAVKTGKHGLAAECKACWGQRTAADAQRRREENPEEVRGKNNAKAERHRRKKGTQPKHYLTPEEKAAAPKKYLEKYKSQPGAFELYLITHARIRNAKHYPNTNFDLTVEWVQQQFAAQEGRCFWLKVPMRLRHNSGPWQVSLDRLQLDVGYTKDNVVLTSKSANMGRMATEVTDFELFLEDVRTSMRMM